jgi:hypothetical protein
MYGVGPVVIWDSGKFVPLEIDNPGKALKAGKFSFELKGQKLEGAFALAWMKGMQKGPSREWLLIKIKDAHEVNSYSLESMLKPAKLKPLKEKVPPCESE